MQGGFIKLEGKIDIHKSTKIFDTLKLTHWYQPIFRLETGNVHGYEALVRDKSSYGLSPIDIFERAEQENCRNTLDCQLLYEAFNSMKKMNACMSFLNIFPSTLLKPGFLPWWKEHLSEYSSVVLEITESEPVSDWSKLKSTINELRNGGAKIALDDMGSGYSFFRHWIELNPEYIKLDRYYAAGLAQSLPKQRVLESLITLFDNSTEVILEGIETTEDLETAKSLGIHFAQGFLLGKPFPLEYEKDNIIGV